MQKKLWKIQKTREIRSLSAKTMPKRSAASARMREYWANRREFASQTSQAVRWRIVALQKEGHHVSDIARMVAVDRGTVRNWVRREAATGKAVDNLKTMCRQWSTMTTKVPATVQVR